MVLSELTRKLRAFNSVTNSQRSYPASFLLPNPDSVSFVIEKAPRPFAQFERKKSTRDPEPRMEISVASRGFLMRSKIEVLACPNCLGSLRGANDALICRECERQFAIEHAIPCFAPTNLFYDSYAEEHCPYALSPSGLKSFVLRFFPFWSYREWWFWRRVIPANTERLLDLGCGRGRELFVTRSEETVGFDSSLRFLRDCAAHYDTGRPWDFAAATVSFRRF
jgi:uncharacterized protein YbaR (Trm112 family)